MKLGIGVSAGFHVSLHNLSSLIISEFQHIINFHFFTKNIKYWRSDGVSTGVVR